MLLPICAIVVQPRMFTRTPTTTWCRRRATESLRYTDPHTLYAQMNDTPITVLRSHRGWRSLPLKELWTKRALLAFMVWRDIKVRYRQTALGALWAILQPFLTMVVFTVFFGRMARIDSLDLPYAVFSYAAILPWTLFSQGLTQASNSVANAGAMLKKVYFPRLILPIAQVLVPAVDFVLALFVYFGLMAYYHVPATWRLLWIPVLALATTVTALGPALWLAATNVRYRDVRHAVPFFVQLWMFVTPVIYPTATITAKLQEWGLPTWLYGLNPVAGIIAASRWILLDLSRPDVAVVVTSAVVSLLLLITGAFWFRRTERTFADIA